MDHATPEITVLIATRNRSQLLDRTLESIGRQSLSSYRWEIVVVDNGSTDDTPGVIERRSQELPVIGLREPRPGKNIALNRGLELARGSLLVFTDDDIVADTQWLAELLRASQVWAGSEVFCGPIVPEYPATMPGWLREHKWAGAAYAEFRPNIPEGPLPIPLLPFGPNFAVRASALSKSPFAADLGPRAGKSYAAGGETELLERLRAQGCTFIYIPSANVQHHVAEHQAELKWLFYRAFCFGRGAMVMNPEFSKGRILGFPFRLWIDIAVARIAYLRSFACDEKTRFEKGVRLHLLRGNWHQMRTAAGGEPLSVSSSRRQ